MRKRATWLFALLFLLVGSLGSMAFYLTEFKWFQSLEFQQIFLTILFNRVFIALIATLISFLFIFLNLKWLQKWLGRNLSEEDTDPEVIQVDFGPSRERLQSNLSELGRSIARSPILSWLIFGFSAVVALLNGLALSAQWLTIQKFLKQVPYGVNDPIFNKDVSFYLFSLPFYELLLESVYRTSLFILGICIFFYLTNGGLNKKDENRKNYAHLGLLGAWSFLLQGLQFYISMHNLVYSPRGVAFGAAYADVHASIPTYYITMGLCVLGILLMLSQLVRPSIKTAVLPVVLVVAVSFAGHNVAATLMQNLQVKPNEFTMEEKYLDYNIQFTRLAYDLENTTEINFPISGRADADWNQLEEYSVSLRTAPLLNWAQTQQAFSQLQGMRLYYRFNDVDIDRYMVNGTLMPVMLSPRELSVNALPSEAGTWVNRHLKYTHGYGVVVAPNNRISNEGQPVLVVQDIPPYTTVEGLEITRPEVYYGELTEDYVIVGTKSKEFDYPIGNTNAETVYEAEAGLSISSFFSRLLFSIRFNTLNPLLTNEITENSKVLMHRQIEDRVSTIAPFLNFDYDPYMVIHEGQLIWIIDAYTITSRFPFAQSWQQDSQVTGPNYIRNSVKITVNAYDGEVKFYLFDTTDPLVLTYAKIFPDLFTSFEEMPQGLKEHLRYPEDIFKVQAKMLLNYHMTNTKVFYNREDAWAIAKVSGQPVEPYYDIMEFPNSDEAKFMTLYPLTPSQKDNMVAFLSGVCDDDGKSSLSVYLFPKDKLVYGPGQIEARINQDSSISKDLALWGQGSSTVSRGHTVTVPLKDSLIYVVPLYITSTSTSLPELKKVIVSYGNRLAMEDNLDLALLRLFGKTDGETGLPGITLPEGEDQDFKQLIDNILRQYQRVLEQKEKGNWTDYGAAMDALEELLKELGQKDLSLIKIILPNAENSPEIIEPSP